MTKGRICLILFFTIIISISAFSKAELDKLREGNVWLVGKGTGSSERNADKQAIRDLLSQITVQVQSSFEDILTEENGNVNEYSSLALKTYSSARLDGAERSIFEDGNKFIVYRYLKKADKDKIFAKRQRLIKDYARRGREAEKEIRIGDALMNYYWSLVLLRTHPNWDKISESFDNREESLITFLPDRIRRIFSLLHLKIVNKRYDTDDEMSYMRLMVTYKNKPVRNLDLKYYLGSGWSVPIGVSQGKALLDFMCNLDEIPYKLKLNILYNDTYKASHNTDLRRVLDDMPCPAFRESRFEIILDETKIKKDTNIEINTLQNSIPLKQYKNLIETTIEAINSQNYSQLDKYMTDSGKESFADIVIKGNAKLLDSSANLSALKHNNKKYIRGLPVQLDYPQSGRKFNEELVFTVNENDKIEKVKFALSDAAKKDILGKVVASDEEKFLITDFIEQYKTAYSTKDIDFIEKVFADNALIIVGQMLKEEEKIDGMYKKLGKNWRPIRYSKKQYIRNLKSIFAGNEFVNLHFEDNKVSRVNSDSTKVFGIQIHQYYYSQRYSDEGYLFLMFDLTDIDKPKIYVRTWQPEKNSDGSIYGLDDFYLPNK